MIFINMKAYMLTPIILTVENISDTFKSMGGDRTMCNKQSPIRG